MVAPAVVAAGISTAGGLLGSLLGGSSQRRANEANERLQREFAQNGIRWKVEDAKAAGLHPLFALGGSGASYAPSAQPVFNGAELGQNISRAASAFMTAQEEENRAAQLRALNAAAEKDQAQAAYWRSEAARSSSNPVAPVAESFPLSLPGQALVRNSRESMVSTLDSRELPPLAAPGPGDRYLTNASGDPAKSLKRWAFPGVGEFIAPDASDFGQSMESIENLGLQAAIVYANLEHYGKEKTSRWLSQLSKSKWWSSPWEAAARSFGLWLDSHRR